MKLYRMEHEIEGKKKCKRGITRWYGVTLFGAGESEGSQGDLCAECFSCFLELPNRKEKKNVVGG